MSEGLVRKRIFERAKGRSDYLFSETMKVIPYSKKIQGQWLIRRAGDLKRISKNARNVQSIIPEVADALESDVSAINFEELERKDRRHRIFGKISKIFYYASFVAIGIGAFVSLAIPKMVSSPDERLYNTGLYIAVGGISFTILTSAARELIEYLRPGVQKIKKAIEYMRDGLNELGQSLQELLDTTSALSK